MTGHRVTIDWMGTPVETLADLIPQSPRAVCVGINPAPTSVAAGHYYQGPLGQRFYQRLISAGVVGPLTPGREDEEAFAAGIGFTDVVKRPTGCSGQMTAEEMAHGAQLLGAKLRAVAAPVLIFTFKKAAVSLVGKFDGNGWIAARFAGARIFVMPGPFEAALTADPTIATLRDRLP